MTGGPLCFCVKVSASPKQKFCWASNKDVVIAGSSLNVQSYVSGSRPASSTCYPLASIQGPAPWRHDGPPFPDGENPSGITRAVFSQVFRPARDLSECSAIPEKSKIGFVLTEIVTRLSSAYSLPISGAKNLGCSATLSESQAFITV